MSLWLRVTGAVAAAAALGCGSDLVLPEDRTPAKIAILQGDGQSGTPGGALPESLVVRVTDVADRPVSGGRVVFTLLDAGAVTPDSASTDGDGRAAASWTLSGTPGTQHIQARPLDADRADLVASFTATAVSSAIARLGLSTQPPPTAAAGVAFGQAPAVQLLDARGQPVVRAGITVVAALASGNGTLGGTIRRQTDASGRAVFDDLYVSGPAGRYTIIFSAGGVTSVTSDPIALSQTGAGITVTIASHSPDPSDVGRAVLFSVQVRPAQGGAAPDGEFRVGASTGETGSGVTSRGLCELIFNSPGPRTVTATFLGGGGFDTSTSSPVTHTVRDVPGATRTILGAAPDPVGPGEQIRAFVTVRGTGGTPAVGGVTIFGDGSERCGQGDLLGTVELDRNGKSILTLPTGLPRGFHVLRACYAGAVGFAPSEDLATVTVQ